MVTRLKVSLSVLLQVSINNLTIDILHGLHFYNLNLTKYLPAAKYCPVGLHRRCLPPEK